MAELVIRGADVVTPQGVQRCDVAIDDGCYSAVAQELPGGIEEMDARGLTLLPGLIDVHLHFNEPGRMEWEGAASGSRAFAAGGGTLYFDMPVNSSPCTLDGASFDAKRAALEASSVTDFALWGGLVPGPKDGLHELAERGAIGFKAFMSDSGLTECPRADDLTLYEGMRVAARYGIPVAVHAESEEITQGLAAKATRRGVRDYLASRPVVAELEAIQRATLLAGETGAALHIVHISSGRGVALALEARARGVDVSIETCPHYLYFTEDDMERIGAAAKCAPPLRPAAVRDELWQRLLAGDIDMVSSDHSPSSPDLKLGGDFFRVWGGIAGVQSTLAVLLQRGASLERIAAVTAANPARRFGMANRSGIAIGMQANCALVDLQATYTLHASDLLYRHALSPYVGSTFRGVVHRTLLRGATIYTNRAIPCNGSDTHAAPRKATMRSSHPTPSFVRHSRA